MSHKIDISVISQKAPNKKQRKEEIKRSKSHLPTKVLFNLTTKYAVVLVVQSLCRGFSVHGILRARIWSGLPFPSLGDLPNPGIEPRSPALQAISFLHCQQILYRLSQQEALKRVEGYQKQWSLSQGMKGSWERAPKATYLRKSLTGQPMRGTYWGEKSIAQFAQQWK